MRLLKNRSRVCLLVIFFMVWNVPSAQTIQQALLNEGDSIQSLDEFRLANKKYGLAAQFARIQGDIYGEQDAMLAIIDCLYTFDKFEEAIDSIDRWLPYFNNSNKESAQRTAKCYLFRGLSFRCLENFSESLNSYNKAIQIYSSAGINHPNHAFAFRYASTIYTRRVDHTKAINYLERALVVDSTQAYLPDILILMANNYLYMDDFDKCIAYAEKTLKLAEDYQDRAFLFMIEGAAYYKKGQIKRGRELVLKSLELYLKDDSYWEEQLRCMVWLAEMAENKNKAVDYLTKTLKILQKFAGKNSRERARVYCLLGDISFEKPNLLDSALAHYQQALIQVFPNFNSTNVADNPDLKDVYTESWIMTAAARKAEALHRRYQQRGNLADLHNAAYCYDLSLAAVKELHKSYGSDAAKLYMGDYSHNYWEEAIEVNFLLYSKTGNHAYLEKIFSLMEKSKASVLSEAIQKNRALLLVGIPDSLLEREKDLRITIAELTTQLRNTEVEGQGSGEALAKVKGQLSDAHLEHERLLESLKNTYPSFKAFVEDAPLPTLDEARANLTKEGQVFAEYFAGKAAIYCLYFDKKGASVFKIDRTESLNKTLQEYLSFFSDGNAILVNPAAYLCVANELYDLLVVKIFAREKAQKIVLALDGILGFLPFDALVVKEEGIKMGFNKVDFLIKNVELRYAYSANVLLQQMENRQSKGYFLRIMPRFADGERGLAPLSFSDEETAGVNAWTSLNGKNATKIGFRKLAEKSWLIHLSTHADSDGEQGEPFIEMADGRLMLSELYAMNLTATDLVILSACETGLGKVERGEGVMSLARGFAYAGANSLVASQWKVNERSTALLFQRFYLYLKAGKTKSEALRLAKLWALENAGTDARQSPYYWAGFIFMGCDGKMELPNKWQNWGLAAGGFGLVFGTLFFFRRRQRKITA